MPENPYNPPVSTLQRTNQMEQSRGKVRTQVGTVPGMSFIYVMQSGEFVKIGYSGRPQDRLRSLLGSMPYDCSLVAHFEAPAAVILRIEAYLHRSLEKHRHRGEWFRMDAAIAEKVVGLLIDKLTDDKPRSSNGAYLPFFSRTARKWRTKREKLDREIETICGRTSADDRGLSALAQRHIVHDHWPEKFGPP